MMMPGQGPPGGMQGRPPMMMGPGGPGGPPPMGMGAPPMLGMPPMSPFDPNYHHWYNNYSWWYYSGADHGTIYHTAVDAKTARIAYVLTGQLVRDRITEKQRGLLTGMKIKVFDFSITEGDISGMMSSLGIAVETVKGQQVGFHVVSHKLQPNQVVVINALHHPQPKEVVDAFATFVSEGGRLLFFNTASHLAALMFPGKIAPAPPSTTIASKLKIMAEKELFEGAFQGGERIELEFYRYPVEVVDKKAVKVICQSQARFLEPLFLSWEHGHGMVYMFVSKLFLRKKSKEEEQADFELKEKEKQKKLKKDHIQSAPGLAAIKQETPVGIEQEKPGNNGADMDTGAMQPPAQQSEEGGSKKRKKKAEYPADFDEFLESKGASESTRTAWKCAIHVNYLDAYSLAKRALPSMEMMARLISREQAVLEDMFETTTDGASEQQGFQGQQDQGMDPQFQQGGQEMGQQENQQEWHHGSSETMQ